jgi:Pretoxin HINT domain
MFTNVIDRFRAFVRNSRATTENPRNRAWLEVTRLEERLLLDASPLSRMLVASGPDLGHAVLATFTSPDPLATADDFSVQVQWGDGQSDAANLVADGGSFSVMTEGHAYPGTGLYTLTVSITTLADGTTDEVQSLVLVAYPEWGGQLDPVGRFDLSSYADFPSLGSFAFGANQLTAESLGSTVAGSGFALAGFSPAGDAPTTGAEGEDLVPEDGGEPVFAAAREPSALAPSDFGQPENRNLSPLSHLHGEGSEATGSFTLTNDGQQSHTVTLSGTSGADTITLVQTVDAAFTSVTWGDDIAGNLTVTDTTVTGTVTAHFVLTVSSLDANGNPVETTTTWDFTDDLDDTGAFRLTSLSWSSPDLSGYTFDTSALTLSATDSLTFHEDGQGFTQGWLETSESTTHADTFTYDVTGSATHTLTQTSHNNGGVWAPDQFSYQMSSQDTFALDVTGNLTSSLTTTSLGSESLTTLMVNRQTSLHLLEEGGDSVTYAISGHAADAVFALDSFAFSKDGNSHSVLTESGTFSNIVLPGQTITGTFSALFVRDNVFAYAEQGVFSDVVGGRRVDGLFTLTQSGTSTDHYEENGTFDALLTQASTLTEGGTATATSHSVGSYTQVGDGTEVSSRQVAASYNYTRMADPEANTFLVVGTQTESITGTYATTSGEGGDYDKQQHSAVGPDDVSSLVSLPDGSSAAGTVTYDNTDQGSYQNDLTVAGTYGAGRSFAFTLTPTTQSADGSFFKDEGQQSNSTLTANGTISNAMVGGTLLASSMTSTFNESRLLASGYQFSEAGTFADTLGVGTATLRTTAGFTLVTNESSQSSYSTPLGSFVQRNGAGMGGAAAVLAATEGSGKYVEGTFSAAMFNSSSSSGTDTGTYTVIRSGDAQTVNVTGAFDSSTQQAGSFVYAENASVTRRTDESKPDGPSSVRTIQSTTTTNTSNQSSRLSLLTGTYQSAEDPITGGSSAATVGYHAETDIEASNSGSDIGSFTITNRKENSIDLNLLTINAPVPTVDAVGALAEISGSIALDVSIPTGIQWKFTSASFTETYGGGSTATYSEDGTFTLADIHNADQTDTRSRTRTDGSFDSEAETNNTYDYQESGTTAGSDTQELSLDLGVASGQCFTRSTTVSQDTLTQHSETTAGISRTGTVAAELVAGTGIYESDSGSYARTEGTTDAWSFHTESKTHQGNGAIHSESGVGGSLSVPVGILGGVTGLASQLVTGVDLNLFGASASSGSRQDGTYTLNEGQDDTTDFTSNGSYIIESSSGALAQGPSAAAGAYSRESGTATETTTSHSSYSYDESGGFAHRKLMQAGTGEILSIIGSFSYVDYFNDKGSYFLSRNGAETFTSTETTTYLTETWGKDGEENFAQSSLETVEAVTDDQLYRAESLVELSEFAKRTRTQSGFDLFLANGSYDSGSTVSGMVLDTKDHAETFTYADQTTRSTWFDTTLDQSASTFTGNYTITKKTDDSSSHLEVGAFENSEISKAGGASNPAMGAIVGFATLGPIGAVAGSLLCISASYDSASTGTGTYSTDQTRYNRIDYSEKGGFTFVMSGTAGAEYGTLHTAGETTFALGIGDGVESASREITGTYTLTAESGGTSDYDETASSVLTASSYISTGLEFLTDPNIGDKSDRSTNSYTLERSRDEDQTHLESGQFHFTTSNGLLAALTDESDVSGTAIDDRSTHSTESLTATGTYIKHSYSEAGFGLSGIGLEGTNQIRDNSSQGQATTTHFSAETSTYHGDGVFSFTRQIGLTLGVSTVDFTTSDSEQLRDRQDSTGTFVRNREYSNAFTIHQSGDTLEGSFTEYQIDQNDHTYQTKGTTITVTANHDAKASLLWNDTAGLTLSKDLFYADTEISFGTYTEHSNVFHDAQHTEDGTFTHATTPSDWTPIVAGAVGGVLPTLGWSLVPAAYALGSLTSGLENPFVSGNYANSDGTYTLSRRDVQTTIYDEEGAFVSGKVAVGNALPLHDLLEMGNGQPVVSNDLSNAVQEFLQENGPQTLDLSLVGTGAVVAGSYTVSKSADKYYSYDETGSDFYRANPDQTIVDTGTYHQTATSTESYAIDASGYLISMHGAIGPQAQLSGASGFLASLNTTVPLVTVYGDVMFVVGAYSWTDSRDDFFDYREDGTFTRTGGSGNIGTSGSFTSGDLSGGYCFTFGNIDDPATETVTRGPGTGTYVLKRTNQEYTQTKHDAVFVSLGGDAGVEILTGAVGGQVNARGTKIFGLYDYTHTQNDTLSYDETGQMDDTVEIDGLPPGHEVDHYHRTRTQTDSADLHSKGTFTTTGLDAALVAQIGTSGTLLIGGALVSLGLTGAELAGTYTINASGREDRTFGIGGNVITPGSTGTYDLTTGESTSIDLQASGAFMGAAGDLNASLLFSLVTGKANAQGSGAAGTYTVTETSTASVTYTQTANFTDGVIGGPSRNLGSGDLDGFTQGALGEFTLGGLSLSYGEPFGGDKRADGTATYSETGKTEVTVDASGAFGVINGDAGLALNLFGTSWNVLDAGIGVTGSGSAGTVSMTKSESYTFTYDESGSLRDRPGVEVDGTYSIHRGHLDLTAHSASGAYANAGGSLTAHLDLLSLVGANVSISGQAGGVVGSYSYDHRVTDTFTYSESANYTLTSGDYGGSIGCYGFYGVPGWEGWGGAYGYGGSYGYYGPGTGGNGTVTGSYSYSSGSVIDTHLNTGGTFVAVDSNLSAEANVTALGFTVLGVDGTTRSSGSADTGSYTYDRTGNASYSFHDGASYQSDDGQGYTANGSYSRTENADDSFSFNASGQITSFSSTVTVTSRTRILGITVGRSTTSITTEGINSSGNYTLTDDANIHSTWSSGGSWSAPNVTGSFTSAGGDHGTLTYRSNGIVSTVSGSASGSTNTRIGIGSFGVGFGGNISGSVSNDVVLPVSYTLTQTADGTYSNSGGWVETFSGECYPSEGSYMSGSSYTSTGGAETYTDSGNGAYHRDYTESKSGLLDVSLTENASTSGHGEWHDQYNDGNYSSASDDSSSNTSTVYREGTVNLLTGLSLSSYTRTETNQNSSQSSSDGYSSSSTSSSSYQESLEGTDVIAYTSDQSGSNDGQTWSSHSEGTFPLGSSSGWSSGVPTWSGPAVGWLQNRLQALESLAVGNLHDMIDQAAQAGHLSGTDLAGGVNQILGRLTTSVTGLIDPVIDAAMAKTIRAIGVAANPVGLGLPGKISGSLTGAQRLEILADHTTMFLNGFTFGTIQSLREESAKLAKKYGDATYWAANVAGAATAVVAVVVGTILTEGALPELLAEGAAVGFALGAGRQLAEMLDGTRDWGDFNWGEVAQSTLLGAYLMGAMQIPYVGQALGASMMIEAAKGAAGAFKEGHTFTGIFEVGSLVGLALLAQGKKGAEAKPGEGVSERAGEVSEPRTAVERSRVPEERWDKIKDEYASDEVRVREGLDPSDPEAARRLTTEEARRNLTPLERGLTRENRPAQERERLAEQACEESGQCFAGEVLILTADGFKRMDALRSGDQVWSRPDTEPQGALQLRLVQEVFTLEAEVWNLHAAGQVIRTTALHPFFERDRGWTAARSLRPGDAILTYGGHWAQVEGVAPSGATITVYNCSIVGDHTYFVAASPQDVWLWAHNAGKCQLSAEEKAELEALREKMRTADPNDPTARLTDAELTKLLEAHQKGKLNEIFDAADLDYLHYLLGRRFLEVFGDRVAEHYTLRESPEVRARLRQALQDWLLSTMGLEDLGDVYSYGDFVRYREIAMRVADALLDQVDEFRRKENPRTEFELPPDLQGEWNLEVPERILQQLRRGEGPSGPALAIGLDPLTGRIRIGLNTTDAKPPHSPVAQIFTDRAAELNRLLNELYTEGQREQLAHNIGTVGSHAEVDALNQLAVAAGGTNVTPADLASFLLFVTTPLEGGRIAAGHSFPRCLGCWFLTFGAHTLSEGPRGYGAWYRGV